MRWGICHWCSAARRPYRYHLAPDVHHRAVFTDDPLGAGDLGGVDGHLPDTRRLRSHVHEPWRVGVYVVSLMRYQTWSPTLELRILPVRHASPADPLRSMDYARLRM